MKDFFRKLIIGLCFIVGTDFGNTIEDKIMSFIVPMCFYAVGYYLMDRDQS